MKKTLYLFMIIVLSVSVLGYADWFAFITNSGTVKINTTQIYGTNLSCTDIIGGSDGDYCADSTGAGGSQWTLETDGWLYNSSNTLAFNQSRYETLQDWNNLSNIPAGFADGVDNVGGGGTSPLFVGATYIQINTTTSSGVSIYNATGYYVNGVLLQDTNDSIDVNNLITENVSLHTQINAVNTSANIKGLGFNITTELKTYFDSIYTTVSAIYDLGYFNVESNLTGLLDNNYINLTQTFSGEVSGTYDAIVLDHDALDDQYYDSEADLTGLLDDNYLNLTDQRYNDTDYYTGSPNITISSTGSISFNGSDSDTTYNADESWLYELSNVFYFNLTKSNITYDTRYYKETEIDTQAEMEAIWSVSLANDNEIINNCSVEDSCSPIYYYGGLSAENITTGEIPDARVSDTLTASDLVAGSEVVADAEVVNDITLNSTSNIIGNSNISITDGTSTFVWYIEGTSLLLKKQ